MEFAFIDAPVVVAALAAPALSPVVTVDGILRRSTSTKSVKSLGSDNSYAGGVYYQNDPAQTAETNAHCNHG